jgi:hypothetical protein
MTNSNEQMQIEFHNSANALFISVYKAFEKSVANVSRRNEEYKFQQLKKQYAATLEQELHAVAKNVLAKHRNEKQVNELDQMFHQFINDYLHRFIQKVNDL